MSRYNFVIISPLEHDWAEIESCVDATVFHTRQWNGYLSAMHQKSIVVAISSSDNKERIGFFIGTRKWLGIKMIGAPSGGMGTFVQGLCLKTEVQCDERIRIYQELVAFFFKHRIAGYVQISDWRLMSVYDNLEARMTWSMPALDQLDIYHSLRISLFIDVRLQESELWANLQYKSCKYAIHKAEKMGLTVKCIEREEDIPSFVDTLSELIEDVSRRKKEKRHVHHNKKHLKALCKSLFPDRVLMLQVVGRADDGEEHVMASSIFCVGNAASTYYSGASKEVYMKYCPNELMVWEALKMLHQRGAGDLILGDVAHYKKKFGPSYAYLPMMIFTKYPFLRKVRMSVKKTYKMIRNRF